MVGSWVGYTGGTEPAPTYESVCARNNTHSEAVKLAFDPAQLSYEELMQRLVDDPRVHALLVEPSGHSYVFELLELTSHWCTTAVFFQPITRRLLMAPEVLRLAHQLERDGQVLVLETFKHREAIRGLLQEEESLGSFLCSQAGRELDVLLECLEPPLSMEGFTRMQETLEEYYACLEALAWRSPETLQSCCAQNEQLALQRGKVCAPLAWTDALQQLQMMHETIQRRSQPARQRPRAALATWLRS